MKIKSEEIVYIALNKPVGYVCALKDNTGPTILELIDEKIKGLHIVGRLDKDTTGLILLTNDGEYTHRSTHPKNHVEKVYEVSLFKDISNTDIKKLENGILIDQGIKLKPAKVYLINERNIQLTITEGKFHQVKKMMLAIDNKVIKLNRIKFDNVLLSDLDISEGKWKKINI